MIASITLTKLNIELKQDISPKHKLSCQTGSSACVTLRVSINAINAIETPLRARLISYLSSCVSASSTLFP